MGCINSTNKPLFALKRDDVFSVSVVRVQSNQSLALARHGFLEVTPHELIFIASEQEPVSWALQHLRRYGLTGNIFSFEAGRRCPNGAGIYTFRCCNADQFYAKFQRCINSMSVVGDRSNNSIHPSQIFGRSDSYQPHTNQYLEPTSMQVTGLDDSIVLPDSFSNDTNDFNLNSPVSVQSSSLTAEMIHFPSSAPPYSNISPNPQSSSNIYMEQPIRINNEHNNNICLHAIIDSSTRNHCRPIIKPLLKSSSLDVPPEECAPILNTNALETQKLYENIDASVVKSASSPQNTCDNSTERYYANVDFLPRLDTHIEQSKSFHLDCVVDQQQHVSTKAPIVNYIILDLDQPHSPSHCSPKNGFGSGQSLSESGVNVTSYKKVELPPTDSALPCSSSTMPKGSTVSDDSSNNKMESSDSYTRIDFLKTFALMKSTNYADFDLENEQEESRITRHSKFVRKAYSISE